MVGVFCFSGRNLWKQISVFHSVSNQWLNLCKLKCGRVLKQAYLLLSVCQDLSDTSWLSLQENSIYTANDEQSPTLVWLGAGSLCNEIHCVCEIFQNHKNFYRWPEMEFRSGPGQGWLWGHFGQVCTLHCCFLCCCSNTLASGMSAWHWARWHAQILTWAQHFCNFATN